MEKNCLECGRKIIGRDDKKFCSDGCRNTYNNKLNKDRNNLVRNINNRLRKNYRILAQMNTNEAGKSKTTRNKLISMGFDFNIITSIYTTKTGNTYYFLYDQGYMFLENEGIVLVKRD